MEQIGEAFQALASNMWSVGPHGFCWKKFSWIIQLQESDRGFWLASCGWRLDKEGLWFWSWPPWSQFCQSNKFPFTFFSHGRSDLVLTPSIKGNNYLCHCGNSYRFRRAWHLTRGHPLRGPWRTQLTLTHAVLPARLTHLRSTQWARRTCRPSPAESAMRPGPLRPSVPSVECTV